MYSRQNLIAKVAEQKSACAVMRAEGGMRSGVEEALDSGTGHELLNIF